MAPMGEADVDEIDIDIEEEDKEEEQVYGNVAFYDNGAQYMPSPQNGQQNYEGNSEGSIDISVNESSVGEDEENKGGLAFMP